MNKAKVRTYSAPDDTIQMLGVVADYHQLSKSATIAALIKKEFWRLFPQGTGTIRPLKGARIERSPNSRRRR